MEDNSQGKRLANLVCELENLEAEKAETVKNCNAAILAQRGAIATLAEEIRHGQGSLIDEGTITEITGEPEEPVEGDTD